MESLPSLRTLMSPPRAWQVKPDPQPDSQPDPQTHSQSPRPQPEPQTPRPPARTLDPQPDPQPHTIKYSHVPRCGSLEQVINPFLPPVSPHPFLPHESTGSFRELSELGLQGQCLAQPVPILRTHKSLPECTQLNNVCTKS